MDERPGNGSDQHVDESTIHSVAGEPPIGANGSSTGGATGSTDDHAHAGAKDDDEIRNPPKVGDDDTNGVKIKKIFKSTRRFVIYEADNEVRYRLPENPEIGRKLCQRVADLGGLRASIDDLRAEDCLSTNEKERAARELAWALALRFEEGENNPPSEDPKKILTQVDGRLRSLVKSHYRKKYVFANLAAFIVIEAILISIAVALAGC